MISNPAALALLAFVCLGLLGLTCWALLWIWAKREDEAHTARWAETWRVFRRGAVVYQSRDGRFYVLFQPWLDSEPFTGDLAWPKRPREIYDWSQDA